MTFLQVTCAIRLEVTRYIMHCIYNNWTICFLSTHSVTKMWKKSKITIFREGYLFPSSGKGVGWRLFSYTIYCEV